VASDLSPPGQTSMWCWVADTLGLDCCDAGSPYIEHRIEVRCGRNSFVICKRYSEFVSLVKQLKDALPPETNMESYELLPAKTYLGHDFSETFLKNRHNQLRIFLEKLCLELCDKKLIRTNHVVQGWFHVLGEERSNVVVA